MKFSENKSIYLQIADKICEDILTGKYQEGSRILSVRECAAEVEVNSNTIMRTYDFLQQQDIIYTQRGLGYFVKDGARKNIRKVRKEEFFNETLPEIAHTMQTLEIEMDELIKNLQKLL